MNLEEIKQQLLDLQAELEELEQVGEDAASTVELDQTRVGRLSRMDAMQAQAMSQETLRRRRELKQRIEPALRRIANGEYGFCLDCDEQISMQRLEFDPTCLYCVSCAEKRES